ncbi:DUF6471 domain-containing protein [Alteromonas sp. ASW11-36]|uniref:DUF6471 domain-containing protein n=1 Tax=Alteromonas arenosi TaxID=3055817 RepID=A0ABT7SU05_9ALTE|nr:DUF6471 domain-containing protein [Alteromonas sp. ASW11-36]MDM7859677.1 DUF6471 domain-containing protein [Alteromonas sp. ASW11-36]
MGGNSTLQWRTVVQRLIKTEMSRRDVRYQELSERLAAVGTQQSADNLRNKVNKGILGADLLLQILSVLQVKNVNMQELEDIFTDIQGR